MRWAGLALGGAAVAAAVTVAVVAVGGGGDAACAAALRTTGRATFYVPASAGGGNCMYPALPADGLYVALSPGEYAGAAACGGYLDVRGPGGTVRVEVVDQCPECERGHVDLSRTAFQRISGGRPGEVPVSYRQVVDPAGRGGPLAFRVKEGSSRWWLNLLPVGAGNPLAAVRVNGVALARTAYGYWEAKSGAGPGPFTVVVTDVAGHRVTVGGVLLRPGVVQRTAARMYGTGAGRAPAHRPSASAAVSTAVSTTPAGPAQASSVPASSAPAATATPAGRC